MVVTYVRVFVRNLAFYPSGLNFERPWMICTEFDWMKEPAGWSERRPGKSDDVFDLRIETWTSQNFEIIAVAPVRSLWACHQNINEFRKWDGYLTANEYTNVKIKNEVTSLCNFYNRKQLVINPLKLQPRILKHVLPEKCVVLDCDPPKTFGHLMIR